MKAVRARAPRPWPDTSPRMKPTRPPAVLLRAGLVPLGGGVGRRRRAAREAGLRDLGGRDARGDGLRPAWDLSRASAPRAHPAVNPSLRRALAALARQHGRLRCLRLWRATRGCRAAGNRGAWVALVALAAGAIRLGALRLGVAPV